MRITETLSKPGSFDVRLDDPPDRVLAWQKGDQLIAQDVWTPIDGLPRADLLATARWRGVLEGWSEDRRSLSGAGMAWYLGDAAKIGAGNLYTSQSPRTLASWAALYAAAGHLNGLVPATTSTPSSTYPDSGSDGELPYNTRDAFDFLCRRLGAEYEVDPDGTFRLYGIGHGFEWEPRWLLTRDALVPIGDDRAGRFPVRKWDVGKDYEDWINYERVEGKAGVLGAGNYLGVETARDAGGVNAVRRKVAVSAPEAVTVADANALGAADVAARYGVRTLVDVSVEVPHARARFRPGDVFALDDSTDRLHNYQPTWPDDVLEVDGRTLYPTSLRVFGMTWSPSPPAGVWHLPSDASKPPVDLTPYVPLDEAPVVDLDVGSPRRSAFDA